MRYISRNSPRYEVLILLPSIIYVIALVFPYLYFSELVRSFLPTIAVCWIIYTTSILCILAIRRRKRLKIAHLRVLFVGLILAIGLNSHAIYRVWNFYGSIFQQKSAKDTPEEKIKIMFSNLLFSNYDYAGILSAVEAEDPDILGFAEYVDHHDLNLTKLKEIYPYTSIETNQMPEFGNPIFSKYPISNYRVSLEMKNKNIVTAVDIDVNGETYAIYLIHTTAPLGYEKYLRRNSELVEIAELISRDTRENIIVMGDFNTSPWSQAYVDFEKNTSKNMNNAANESSLKFTWGVYGFNNPFVTHIDHFFMSNNLKYGNYKSFTVGNSDHKGISIEIYSGQDDAEL